VRFAIATALGAAVAGGAACSSTQPSPSAAKPGEDAGLTPFDAAGIPKVDAGAAADTSVIFDAYRPDVWGVGCPDAAQASDADVDADAAGDPEAGSTVSFARDLLPLFTGTCATTTFSCHGGNDRQAHLDLTSAHAYADLVGVAAYECADGRMRVSPRAPLGSYLLDKLNGADLCLGERMPQEGDAATPDQLQAITDWICAGAPNN
jgi:hypothetical protein